MILKCTTHNNVVMSGSHQINNCQTGCICNFLSSYLVIFFSVGKNTCVTKLKNATYEILCKLNISLFACLNDKSNEISYSKNHYRLKKKITTL